MFILTFILVVMLFLLKLFEMKGCTFRGSNCYFNFLPPFSVESTSKGNNMLPLKQILSFKSRPFVIQGSDHKVISAFLLCTNNEKLDLPIRLHESVDFSIFFTSNVNHNVLQNRPYIITDNYLLINPVMFSEPKERAFGNS